MFVLPNAGDRVSAKIFEESGFAAIATTSLSISWSNRYKNDDKFSKFIWNVIEAGAVGINLEDGNSKSSTLNDIDYQIGKIKTAKETGKQKGINLFVNVRTNIHEII